MKKMIVIYGPQGCGKTICTKLLAKHYGATKVADGWIPVSGQEGIAKDDVILVLTNRSFVDLKEIGINDPIHFADALRAVNREMESTYVDISENGEFF